MKPDVSIAIIADLHRQTYDPGGAAQRQGYFADIFLLRTVRRLNRFIRPDVTLVLGDLLDEPNAARAERQLVGLRRIHWTCWNRHCIVLPGNHDPAPDVLRIVPPPAGTPGRQGRPVPAVADQQTAGYNARRSVPDIAPGRRAPGFQRPDCDNVVQHVPRFPRCPAAGRTSPFLKFYDNARKSSPPCAPTA